MNKTAVCRSLYLYGFGSGAAGGAGVAGGAGAAGAPTVIMAALSARILGPMPLTLTISSTVLKGPFASRWATIEAASFSPTPLSLVNSAAEAVLILIVPAPAVSSAKAKPDNPTTNPITVNIKNTFFICFIIHSFSNCKRLIKIPDRHRIRRFILAICNLYTCCKSRLLFHYIKNLFTRNKHIGMMPVYYSI